MNKCNNIVISRWCVPTLVRDILHLGESACFLGVVVDVVHPATSTTVPHRTLQTLLFRERLEDTPLVLVSSLQSSYCGENPARSTTSLILDLGYSLSFTTVSGPPVPGSGGRSGGQGGYVLRDIVRDGLREVSSSVTVHFLFCLGNRGLRLRSCCSVVRKRMLCGYYVCLRQWRSLSLGP